MAAFASFEDTARWNAEKDSTAAIAHIKALVAADPSLKVVQSSALGPSGLVITQLLQAEGLAGIPVVFIDTLYHFDETLQLLEHVKASGQQVIVFKPNGFDTREQFEAVHGDALWKTNPDLYDFLVKAEPGRRSNETLGAQIVFTGRRRSQGADRSSLDIFEWDTSYSPPILKVNLLAHWSFDEVWQHIRAHSIRYNVLHDQGYKSVGDYHSTVPTSGSGNEREGRWQGQEKTECGLHKDYFKLKAKALAEKRAAEAAAAAAASTAAAATTTAVSEAASSAENL